MAQTTTSEPIVLTDDVDESTDADQQDHDLSLNLGSSVPATVPSARRWTQSETDREFFAIVTDQIAAPTALIDADTGEVAGRSVRTLYGETTWAGTSTPWSYPGQYVDSETGLHYNRHRYYHPDTGRYLSPDPLGLTPAPNPHAYPANPAVTADPSGLSPTAACGAGDFESRGSTGRTEPHNLIEKLAMEEARSRPEHGEPLRMRDRLGDPRWHWTEGWQKYQYERARIVIHYVYNPELGVADDFKFKNKPWPGSPHFSQPLDWKRVEEDGKGGG